MSITRAAGVCSRTLCERRICRLLFHYKYSLQQIFTPDFNCNAASFLENLTKLLTQLPLACLLQSGLGCLMIKDLLLHTARKEKKIYRPKRRATATKGEALLVLVRQYSSRRCLPPPLSLSSGAPSFVSHCFKFRARLDFLVASSSLVCGFARSICRCGFSCCEGVNLWPGSGAGNKQAANR